MENLNKQIIRRESHVGTGKCADCGNPCPDDKALCNACHQPLRGRAAEVPNPYSKVWNEVKDHEAELLDLVRNGTLFSPTNEELAKRCKSRARFLLEKARNQESKAAGRKIFQEALFYHNMAERHYEEHRRVLALSR